MYRSIVRTLPLMMLSMLAVGIAVSPNVAGDMLPALAVNDPTSPATLLLVSSEVEWGTLFRGIALGQSRAEAEAALAKLDMRCLTADEVARGGALPVETLSGGEPMCRIADAAFTDPQFFTIEMNMRLNVELAIGAPVYAITFEQDVVISLALMPSYFNAGTSSFDAFSQNIPDNYGLDNVSKTRTGWQGTTPYGELVALHYLGQRFYPYFLQVKPAF